MFRNLRLLGCVVAILLLPVIAGAIVEPKTEMEFADVVTLEADGVQYKLEATGTGVREKTFMKVDVYVIVSYLGEGQSLTGDAAPAMLDLDGPKMLHMNLRRGFSREKLTDSFRDVIERNYDDISAFESDLETFLAYFTKDAEENDELFFEYLPGTGLTTRLNGETKGVITNFEFVKALWTVWFGEDPADDDLREELLQRK